MRVSLRGAMRKGVFAAALMVVCLFVIGAAARPWWADRAAARVTRESLAEAIRGEPDNAERYYEYARYMEVVEGDFGTASESLKIATELNPHVGRYWVALARVQRFLGKGDEENRAIENALRYAPADPNIAREAATLRAASEDVAETH